jgi:hypothetical protein
MWSTIRQTATDLLTGMFTAKKPESPAVKLLNRILLVILFVFGLVLWARFLNYGEIPNDRLDWGDITYPRLMVLQQAVQQGVLPLHVDQVLGMKGVTNRYLSVPDLLLSPEVIFLKWLSVGKFILMQVLLLYSVGFWGLLAFKRRFQLSLMAFLPLFLLFNFNGHIVTHLTVGHITWSGYFLLPFFVLLLLDVVQDKPIGWTWVGQFSILQFFIFLQGGYHQFVWILLFMVFLFLGCMGKHKFVFWGMFFAVLVNVYRILPGALLQKTLLIQFKAGFPTVGRLLQSFIELPKMESAYTLANKVNVSVWEFNFFISVTGCLFLVFGILFMYHHRSDAYFRLVLPCVALIVLSIGNFYKPFFESGIPLLSGERLSSRFLILPVVVLLFLAALQIQKQFDQTSSPTFQFGGTVVLILLLANDLTQHLGHWEIKALINYAPPELLGKFPVLGHVKDPIYSGLLIVGVVISLSSAAFLFIKILQDGKASRLSKEI